MKLVRMAGQAQLDLIVSFLAADVPDRLRVEHCLLCGVVPGPEQMRQFICRARNCGLADQGRFRSEQAAVKDFFEVAAEPDLAPDGAVEALNQHVMEAGCLTPAFERGPHGYWRRCVQTNNLRGLVLGALYSMLARQAGDIIDVNAKMTKEEIAAIARGARDRHKDDLDQLAAALVPHMPKAQIARVLARKGRPVDPKTVDTMIDRGRRNGRKTGNSGRNSHSPGRSKSLE